MEEKKFFEAFPTLQLNNELSGFFREAVVYHIAMNSQRTYVKIYVRFNRLIGRDILNKIETELKRQIKPFFAMDVYIVERFNLSSLHTPETILTDYRESMLFELKKRNMILYQLLREATFEVEEDSLINIVLSDNFVSKEYSDELIDAISDMFINRFGMEVKFFCQYVKPKENRQAKEAEFKMARMVEEISKRAYENKKEEEKVAENTDKPAKEEVKPKKPYKQIIAKRSDNPDVVYGRDVLEECITLDTVLHEMGEIVFRGMALNVESREIKSGKFIMTIDITDFTDSITVKLFLNPEPYEEIKKEIKKGGFYKIKGVTTIDKFSGELSIASVVGIVKIPDFRTKRMDMAMEKRVELHCHTKMSELDGVSDAKALVGQACDWGHPALAITDHGVVQGFTEAFHTKLSNKEFKIIYGVEAYLVDDLKKIIDNPKGQDFDDTYVVFDLETTGLSPVNDHIIEIGAIKIKNRKVVDNFSAFVKYSFIVFKLK